MAYKRINDSVIFEGSKLFREEDTFTGRKHHNSSYSFSFQTFFSFLSFVFSEGKDYSLKITPETLEAFSNPPIFWKDIANVYYEEKFLREFMVFETVAANEKERKLFKFAIDQLHEPHMNQEPLEYEICRHLPLNAKFTGKYTFKNPGEPHISNIVSGSF
ncbi:MAG: hypothetical protein LBG46_00295 [Elusimicrobiota bacterium]|jgi:hypothetical protein|nr:hypothetical protein [Elusimicrobiota bacterium]